MNCGKLLADKWNHYQKRLREMKGPGYAEPTCFDGKKIPKTPESVVFDEPVSYTHLTLPTNREV